MASSNNKFPKVELPEEIKYSSEEQETEAPKEEPKATPKKATKLVHIDDFIEAIRPAMNLSVGKASGFRAYMIGKHYLSSLEAFIPHLETYVGKEVKK